MLPGSTAINPPGRPGHVVLSTGPHLILAPMSTDRARLKCGDGWCGGPIRRPPFSVVSLSLSCVDATLLGCYRTCTCTCMQQMPSGLKRRRHLGVTSGACELSNESKPLLGLALSTGDSTEHPVLVTHSRLFAN